MTSVHFFPHDLHFLYFNPLLVQVAFVFVTHVFMITF